MAHQKTIIRGGTVVTASDCYAGDVLIDGGVIRAVATELEDPGARVIDARGLLVVPGGIDVHTHLDMPFGGTRSTDDFESGTRAAVFGGTTTIVDFAIQERGGTLRQAFDAWMAKAEGKAVIDYGFHLILREHTRALEAEMGALVELGVTSFKLFMAYPGVFYLDDASIFRCMQRAGEIGATVCMHAENGPVIDVLIEQAKRRGHKEPKWHALTRPPRAEAEATHRALCLAEMADAPVYVVHLSAAEALQEVARARERGVSASAETCPQYLFLSHEDYERPGFEGAKFVMSPPLRARDKQAELWRGLALGDLQVISTDHCPFCFKETPHSAGKQLGREDFSKIPNGAPGIEHRLSLVYDGGVVGGRITPNRWVELCSTAPAKLFGLFPRKGTIAPGSDADIALFDPDAEAVISAATHHMNVDYSAYEGRRVRGVTRTVLSRGEVILENGAFVGRAGRGAYLPRKTRFDD